MIEEHPFEDFLPENAHLLMLGTFPAAEKRWSMKWYYPNFQNDMWRIFGLVFFGDKDHFVVREEHRFDMEMLQDFLREKGVALSDTAKSVERTRNTAADKDLKVVEYADLDDMLRKMPQCRAVVTTGKLATEIFAKHYGIEGLLRMGDSLPFTFEGRDLRLYRMPSSSRAYPLAIEKKAECYKRMFDEIL